MISVIVPIFNVEKYLNRCLDSLKKQTMSDVEFILIDDGSTDRSGIIAEGYKDSRFKVFHIPNRGLSAARNFGIEKSQGEYIMFVDADDWVKQGFCKIPFDIAIMTDADIVIFQVLTENCHIVKKKTRFDTPVGIVSPHIATEYGYVNVWNKLYRRELFDSIKYPEGMLFEDIATTHRLVYSAQRIVIIPDYLYCYVQRKGSITRTYTFKNRRDCFIATHQRQEYLLEKGYESATLDGILFTAALGLIVSTSPCENNEYRGAMEILETRKPPRGASLKKRIAYEMWKRNNRLFEKLCELTVRQRLSI